MKLKVTKRKIIILSLTVCIFFLIGFRSVNNQKDIHSTAVYIPPEYISENQYETDILFYDINIDLNTEQKAISGEVSLTGIFKNRSIKQIDLNFYDNFNISEILLNGKPASYSQLDTRLSITSNLNREDTFNIKIVYDGKPVRAGLSAFVFGKRNGKSVVYTINEPTFASTWFPCNDLPSDKAIARISVTNSPDKMSLSNGILVSEKEINGRKTYTWETRYPISTYLIAIYSAEYVNFSENYLSLDGRDSMNIEYYAFPDHVKQAKKDFEDHPTILKVFSELFGEYPFIKEKYGIAEFLWQLGAMENQTITGIGSNFISGNKYFNDILVHEAAHSWWGNSVGPKTWKDIWLNEGFATYSEALYAEKLYGEDALISTMMSKYDENFTGRLYDPGSDLFSSTVYSKGAWVLHMLRWETGDSLFFNILRKYYDSYKYNTASTKDFQQVVETLTAKDFSWFFNQWVLEGEDQIKLEYNWDYDRKRNKIVINLRQVQDKYQVYRFSLPVKVITYEGSEIKVFNIDKRETKLEIPIDTEPQKVLIDPDNRLLADYKEIIF
jgi:aminopeptidase N